MRIRITQLDGALPNIALMKLAHFHRGRGDEVYVTRDIEPDLFEHCTYDRIYASSIFKFSAARIERFRWQWPGAIIGGTGTDSTLTVEQVIGEPEYEHYDYSDYPVDYSIGFTQRGCRMSCKFCVVPTKEGKPRALNTIEQIWRGEPWPRKLHILDNDFFDNPEWQQRAREIIDGSYKVCLSQGINVRLINEQAAAALAEMQYRDTTFTQRRLYTAWDNFKDEHVFFDGVDLLERAGIPPSHLMAYMLIGFDKRETWERIWHRFDRMIERGIRPYPMVFDRSRTDLRAFQRWVVTGLYRATPFDEYRVSQKLRTFVQMSAPLALDIAPRPVGA